MDKFMEDLQQGYCFVPQPFNAKMVQRVLLLPADVDCIVFWTRDPRPLLANLSEIESRGYSFYVHVTLTGYPPILEPHVPATNIALEAIQALSEKIGAERVLWRYDPILLAKGPDLCLDESWHEKNFESLASRLGGHEAGRAGLVRQVTISLLDEYRNTRSRLRRAGVSDVMFGTALQGTRQDTKSASNMRPALAATLPAGLPARYVDLLSSLAQIARRHNLAIKSCAEPWDLSLLGIEPGACVDGELISHFVGEKEGQVRLASAPHESTRQLIFEKDKGQRPYCRCVKSVDIGAYEACPAGCVYCYARR